MLKLLFYSPVKLQAGGGCERWHCDITNSLKHQFSDQVEIVTADLGDNKWTEDYLHKQLRGIPYTQLHFLHFLGVLVPTPKTAFFLYRKFCESDAIHFIYGFAGQDIMVLLLKLFTRKRVVVGHHAPIFHSSPFHNFYMSNISSRLLNFFDAHQTLNSLDKSYMEKKWKIKNVHFIPSGIRIERFSPHGRKSHSVLTCLSVGRYELQKGFDFLLEAIDMFNRTIPNNSARFYFVGAGTLKTLIARFARKNPNIFDLGYIPYEKMPSIYAKSDLFILSSREEPFGLVLVEAWASGIPVLATRTEGPNDMLNPRNGIFISEISADAMCKSLISMYRLWSCGRLKSKFKTSDLLNSAQKFSIDLTAQRMHDQLFQV